MSEDIGAQQSREGGQGGAEWTDLESRGSANFSGILCENPELKICIIR